MAFDWTAKYMIGYDPTTSPDKLSENLANILQGLMSFPLNIPGTAFHKCLKVISKCMANQFIRVKNRVNYSDGSNYISFVPI